MREIYQTDLSSDSNSVFYQKTTKIFLNMLEKHNEQDIGNLLVQSKRNRNPLQ